MCLDSSSADAGTGGGAPDASVGDAPMGADSTPDVSSSVDGSPDAAAYRACFGNSGQILDSIKACATATDCVAITIASCCGPMHDVVAVNQSQAAAFDSCIANSPSCLGRGCASFPYTVAEDGMMIPDGGAAKVRCISTDGGPLLCEASAQ